MKRNLAVPVLLLLLAALIALPAFAGEAKKPVTQKASVTVKTTIEAIDHDARLITLKGKDGEMETIYAGPEIRRFDELKVGDKVTFTYSESVVYQIKKPGEPGAPSASDEPVIARQATAKPSGSMTEQQTATVTVVSIDEKAGAVTVKTEDGRTMTSKVKDKGNLKGVNPGDRVVITYTTALLISVE